MNLSTIRNQNYVRQMLEIQRQFEDEAGEVFILVLLGEERKKERPPEQGEEDDATTSRSLPDHPLDLRVAGSSLR